MSAADRLRTADDASLLLTVLTTVQRLEKHTRVLDEHFQKQLRSLRRLRDPVALRADASFYRIASPVIEDGRTYLGFDRLFTLWQAAQNVSSLGASGAEVGTFRGGSARFLAAAFRELNCPKLEIHVFDTFEGHPADKITPSDTVHSAGRFSDTSLESVRTYLEDFPSVILHPGEFSSQVGTVAATTFGLVHIDVDIYSTTLECLRFFGERLVPGGMMVVDDYWADTCPGVRQAVAEYLEIARGAFTVWRPPTEQLLLISR